MPEAYSLNTLYSLGFPYKQLSQGSLSLDFDPNKIIAGNSTPEWKATELFIWHFFAIGWILRHELAVFVRYHLTPENIFPCIFALMD